MSKKTKPKFSQGVKKIFFIQIIEIHTTIDRSLRVITINVVLDFI